jgi:hypothetical protein
MMRHPAGLHCFAAVIAVLGLALPGAARAMEPRLLPSEASQGLQTAAPAQPLPEDPFEAFNSRQKGRVLVEMRFERADSPPRATVRESEDGREFVNAVRTWATTLPVGDAASRSGLPAGRASYLQPDRRNPVGVLDTYDAAQEPLLQWLRGIELSLPPPTLDAVYRDDALISVPCVKITLNPLKETPP